MKQSISRHSLVLKDQLSLEIFVIFFLVATLFALGLLLICINAVMHSYKGITYFTAPYQRAILPTLLFTLLVIYFKNQAHNRTWLVLTTFGLYALCLDAGLIIAQAIQTTPFSTIDLNLLRFDQWVGINQIQLIQAVHNTPWLWQLLIWAYDSLIPELFILPMLAAFLGHERSVMVFLMAALLSYFFGTLFD
jgi:hypothetical protein